ncbi:short chain dehydrogenase, partial [Gorgonomyces haynaldii]
MKSVIVTGCSKGLGLAIARDILKQGHCVLGSGRSQKPFEAPNFEYLQIDHADLNSGRLLVQKCLDMFGRVDAIVHNAGTISPMGKIADLDLDQFKTLFQVNVYAAIEMIQAGLPELRKNKGSVILVSSGAAVKGYGGWSAYCSSKASLNMLAGSLAQEEDIYAYSVRPGVVDTDMQQYIREHGADIMPDYQKFVSLKETDALLKPEQPAKAIARLALDPIPEWNGQFLQWDS